MAEKLLEQRNISHSQNAKSLTDAKETLIRKAKAKTRGDLPYASVPQQIQLIEELSSFEVTQLYRAFHRALNKGVFFPPS